MDKLANSQQKWLKAAILGSLWASSEIVLGSFLHNLHIPFSSNLLTAIGIILLTSTSYLWDSRGLFWRAGLICALMKTISPSAVIFGPMIAITAEAFLLEAATRVLGRNIAGLLLGSALAMLWNIIQRIFNFIIMYGFDIVDLYTGLLFWASKQLHFGIVSPWSPIVLLASVYLLFGLIAGMLGILLGRRLKSHNKPAPAIALHKAELPFAIAKTGHFKYNAWWILYIIGMLVLGLASINFYQWYIWAPLIAVQVIFIINRYKRAMNSLKKPRFWVVFVLLTMLASFLLSGISSSPHPWQEGLLMGIAMNFRAALIITGFAGLSKELYNPHVRMFFVRVGFTQLPKALEVSFGVLPYILGSLPPVSAFIKKPLHVLGAMVLQLEQWLTFVQTQRIAKPCLVIVTGTKGSGKTSLLSDIANQFQNKGFTLKGILQPATIKDGQRSGYAIMNLATGQTMELANKTSEQNEATIGNYSFKSEALEFGVQALTLKSDAAAVIIDEIGPLELKGKAWGSSLRTLLMEPLAVIIVSVRPSLLDQVLRTYQPVNFKVFAVGNVTATELVDYVVSKIQSTS